MFILYEMTTTEIKTDNNTDSAKKACMQMACMGYSGPIRPIYKMAGINRLLIGRGHFTHFHE